MPGTSQFTFLSPQWPAIAESAGKVESLAHPDARTACFYSRRALEGVVDWLFDHDPAFRRPYDRNLAALMAEPSFAAGVPPHVLLKAKVIRDVGNRAVHGKKPVHPYDALRVTQELFHVLYWFARAYSKDWRHEGLQFDPNLLPKAQQSAGTGAATAQQVQKLAEELKQKDEELADRAKRLAETDAEIARLKGEVAAAVAGAKKRAALIPDPHDYSEAETRDFFIDLLLREAGWDTTAFEKGEDTEYPVTGMPTGGGGYVDYVLWGANGLPLGIVEAKRTKKDAQVGQQQAKLYADCLERMTGQRPVIFYTNAYETWIWDDAFYPPRPVQGFYTKDELALLIERRKTRKAPGSEKINPKIVERYYQVESIRETGEALAKGRRRGLVVMATGAGKTRTVIALADLLQRCNWVKRVLFLADRTALVNQAVNAFKAHLPESSPVNLVTEKEETGSRVYVSTYPTMLNLIDQTRGDARRFGVGFFDLVVIDEAHRSVYQKYRAIFDYFDSLLIGLTATPRDEVDRDTYRLFDLEKGVPTYAYELDQAVKDGFLVPPMAVSVPLRFQREGIKYDDLPEDEKEQWDAIEWDEHGEELIRKEGKVEPEAVNKWLFNEDTVDKVLAHLMQNGIKVAGGDRLGKTIVFAKNRHHARFIQERFDKHYPHLKGTFARVIDHYEPFAQGLLDDFKNPDKPPHVAISVDMLDTGIDVPEAANLVFVKLVRSKTKFFQMIGRGTRLSPNLFGPGRDKENFYIFDYCQNLEFFNQNPAGADGSVQKSLGAMLFQGRLEVHRATGELPDADEPTRVMRAEIADTLHREVAAMNVNNFLVRPKRRDVERYADRKAWDALAADEYARVGHELAGLPSELDPDDETAKRFDLLVLRLQLAVLNHEPQFERLGGQVREIAGALEEKHGIPMVARQMPLILDVQTDAWWENVTLPMLDGARKKLRDLVKFIEKAGRKIVYTDFEDRLGTARVVGITGLAAAVDVAQYKKKVLHFLKGHEHHIVLRKLRRNEPLTPTDLGELERLLYESADLGGRAEFERAYGKPERLGSFIRRLIGLDREAAKRAFGEYLNESRYNANQIRFVNQVIDHLTRNGVMDPGLLYEPPYTDLSPTGLEGLFDDEQSRQIVQILGLINHNAGAARQSA